MSSAKRQERSAVWIPWHRVQAVQAVQAVKGKDHPLEFPGQVATSVVPCTRHVPHWLQELPQLKSQAGAEIPEMENNVKMKKCA